MQYNPFDGVNIIYSKLKAAGIVLTGGLYKFQRPGNSSKEDIVVNSITIDNEQMQSGVFNVNVFAPNLKIGAGQSVDNSQPDLRRLETLAAAVENAINDVYGDSHNYKIDSQQVLPDNDTTHFVNIRVRFYGVNNYN